MIKRIARRPEECDIAATVSQITASDRFATVLRRD